MNKYWIIIATWLIFASCASKRDMYYLQNPKSLEDMPVNFKDVVIQPNDILKITVTSAVPQAAISYNRLNINSVQVANIDILKLDGYVVTNEYTIEFPVLGMISVKNKTLQQLSEEIKMMLQTGGHLTEPGVEIRLLNAKFTVLGEVRKPGTYNYTEANLTLLQALGYAGDLTINGKRENVLLIREIGENRKITHINLKETDWVNSDAYQIQPNDVIVVNPNERAVNNSGVVDLGALLAIVSLTLSVAVLLTR